MKTLRLKVHPLTPFGTLVAGDTLFGHLCWAVRERYGESRLVELLDGYTSGHPFAVLSDGFPERLIPRPTAPDSVFGLSSDPSQRKRARTFCWLPAKRAGQPVKNWIEQLAATEIVKHSVITQNTINRLTGTTGTDQFAPRQVDRISFAEDTRLEIYAVFDQQRLSADQMKSLLADIGLHGYGRDATTGLGKFAIADSREHVWPVESSQHWLTLAPCAPDPVALDAEGCHYLPLTRFGRHGNLAVTLGNPFKSPVLMAATGALLKSREPARWTIHGQGLGGRGAPLSAVLPDTVHQGYAPVVPLTMEAAA